MLSEIYIGKIFYEIIGNKNPEIAEFTVDSYELRGDRVYFPNKHIGKAEYSIYDFGITVFEDLNIAERKLSDMRRVKNE